MCREKLFILEKQLALTGENRAGVSLQPRGAGFVSVVDYIFGHLLQLTVQFVSIFVTDN